MELNAVIFLCEADKGKSINFNLEFRLDFEQLNKNTEYVQGSEKVLTECEWCTKLAKKVPN